MTIDEIRKLIKDANENQIKEINKLRFPVPPVCTVYWSDEDWLTWAASHNKDKFQEIMK